MAGCSVHVLTAVQEAAAGPVSCRNPNLMSQQAPLCNGPVDFEYSRGNLSLRAALSVCALARLSFTLN